jgi:hypothetical protein
MISENKKLLSKYREFVTTLTGIRKQEIWPMGDNFVVHVFFMINEHNIDGNNTALENIR